MQFNVQIPNLSQLLERLAQAPEITAPILQRAIATGVDILASYTIRGIVPWRTGFLTQNWGKDVDGFVGTWFPKALYAPFVEFGTAPHLILPKKGEALMWPGAWHPVRAVQHPGTQPNPFMERILAAAQPDILVMFGTALDQIVAAMAQ